MEEQEEEQKKVSSVSNKKTMKPSSQFLVSCLLFLLSQAAVTKIPQTRQLTQQTFISQSMEAEV